MKSLPAVPRMNDEGDDHSIFFGQAAFCRRPPCPPANPKIGPQAGVWQHPAQRDLGEASRWQGGRGCRRWLIIV